MNEIQDGNDLYWRLYVSSDNVACVVCMQWFDEFDYDQNRFINKVCYTSEEKAEHALDLIKAVAAQPLSILQSLKIAADSLEKL
jgi:hypothetical protein